MERPPEKRAELIRAPEKYTVVDICLYAGEILRKYGEDREGIGHLKAGWPSKLGYFTLRGTRLDEEFPLYQLDAQDEQKINCVDKYMFAQNHETAQLYDTDSNFVDTSTPFENDLAVMMYLRTNQWGLREPQSNQKVATIYRETMAHLAIDTARQNGYIDIRELATSDDRSPIYVANLYHAQQDALESSVKIFDKEFFFTHSEESIVQALNVQIKAYRDSIPALPPAQSDVPPST